MKVLSMDELKEVNGLYGEVRGGGRSKGRTYSTTDV